MIKKSKGLIKIFLAENKDYKNDINRFIYFIENVKGFDLESQLDTLVKGISTELITESANYLIENKIYNKKSTIDRYFVSTKKFCTYLTEALDIEHSTFLAEKGKPDNNEKSYNYQVNNFIQCNPTLQEKISYDALEDEDVNKLIAWCDGAFLDLTDYTREISDTQLKKCIAAICIKLMIFLGITYRRAKALTVNDVSLETMSINFKGDNNSFCVRIPSKLGLQLAWYLNYRAKFLPGKLLFVMPNGKPWGASTSDSGLPYYLNLAIGKTSVTSVLKYGVLQMIQNNMSDCVIKEITGISEDVFSSCFSAQEERRGQVNWRSYVDSRMINTSKFYKL